MNATFTKLKSGEWGIRVVGTAKAGQTVTVTKKDGTSESKTVGKVIWTGNGVSLCTVAQAQTASYTPRAGGRSSGGDMSGRCWECGGRMPQWKADQGEECGYC